MKVWAIVGLWLSLWLPAGLAQTKAPKARAAAPDRDQLGMTCAQILAMSSTDWVAQFNEKAKDAAPEPQKTLRAIAVYGKCYDARTDHLAASLAKSGAGPLMGARGNLRDLQQALDAFTAKALAASDPPADAVKTANAQLYEKQFRYEFYQSYEKSPVAKTASAAPAPAAGTSFTSPPAPPSSPASANSARRGESRHPGQESFRRTSRRASRRQRTPAPRRFRRHRRRHPDERSDAPRNLPLRHLPPGAALGNSLRPAPLLGHRTTTTTA